ncbi:MAG TPA: 4Fe-4S dicluster domain-containing protein, partial [Desulfobacteraceae bacterium]|nr:4Fe-4S dicluster domain-containing protein [Desulfobacteraceae bacterium]
LKHTSQGFRARIKTLQTYIDPNQCVLCGRCAAVCPVSLPDGGKPLRFAGRTQRIRGLRRIRMSPDRYAKLSGTPEGNRHSSWASFWSRSGSVSTRMTGIPSSPNLLVAAIPAGVAPMTITLCRRSFGRVMIRLLPSLWPSSPVP